MQNLEAFLQMTEPEHVFGVVSDRFKDGEGKPIPWEFQAVSHEENRRINALSTTKKKGKETFDMAKYKDLLLVKSVVFPDLQDTKLQERYRTQGDEVATLKALLPTLGEYAVAFRLAQEANGLDADPNEELDEAKNG